jgi:very-short-patch-repair endonuclease
VELDGQIHLRQQVADMIRTEHIEAYGYNVVRFSNKQVLQHWDEVEEILTQFIKKRLFDRQSHK